MQIKRRADAANAGRFRRSVGGGAETTATRQLKSRPRQQFWRSGKFWRWGLVCGGLAFVFLATFGAGSGFGILVERKHLTEEILSFRPDRVMKNYLESLATAPQRLVIDIKHEDQEKLKAWRTVALQRDQITDDLKEYVPARLRFGQETYQAKLRLKGEWIDHLRTTKWSYRIKLEGGKSLLGMTCFGIQHPRVRHYSHEWFYHQALAREDIPCLRYHFLAVTVNGRDLGVYAVEEHFTKEMVEHNRRRQGVIVRIGGEYRYFAPGLRRSVTEGPPPGTRSATGDPSSRVAQSHVFHR